MIAEAMVIAIVLRLLGLVEPFVFQTIIDRVLPFQREAALTLIIVVLFSPCIHTVSPLIIPKFVGIPTLPPCQVTSPDRFP